MNADNFEQLCKAQKKTFNWQHPVLPLVGSKAKQWWREIQAMASLLPPGCKVFDAFAGTFSVSRIMLYKNETLSITANDMDGTYSRRLNAIEQTVALWHEAQEKIGTRTDHTTRTRFTDAQYECFTNILSRAEDKVTVTSWGNHARSPRNMLPTVPPDINMAKRWLDGINVCDIRLRNEQKCVQLSDEFDFIILDPPYKGHAYKEQYSAECRQEAREWAKEIIGKCKSFMLWDRTDSDLINLAMESQGTLIRTCSMGSKEGNRGESLVINLKQFTETG